MQMIISGKDEIKWQKYWIKTRKESKFYIETAKRLLYRKINTSI